MLVYIKSKNRIKRNERDKNFLRLDSPVSDKESEDLTLLELLKVPSYYGDTVASIEKIFLEEAIEQELSELNKRGIIKNKQYIYLKEYILNGSQIVDIANKYNVTRQNVDTTVSRALENLRKYYGTKEVIIKKLLD